MNMKWKDMSPLQKAGLVITFIGAALVLVAMLKPDLFPVKISTTVAIAIMSAGEAMELWEKQRKWAWMLTGAAVICMACYLLELFLL